MFMLPRGRCPLRVPSAGALCRCPLQVHSAGALCRCPLQVPSAGALCRCPLRVPSAGAAARLREVGLSGPGRPVQQKPAPGFPLACRKKGGGANGGAWALLGPRRAPDPAKRAGGPTVPVTQIQGSQSPGHTGSGVPQSRSHRFRGAPVPVANTPGQTYPVTWTTCTSSGGSAYNDGAYNDGGRAAEGAQKEAG